MRSVLAVTVLVAIVAGCSAPSQVESGSPAPSPSTAAPSAKPASTPPLPPPSRVRWAIDRSGDPSRPYFLDFFFDGVATSFRVLDASGLVVLRVPIAGSGIFGPETCVVRARPPGKEENATWISVDQAMLERFTREAASYRVEAGVVGGAIVTLPLTDSGCRAEGLPR